MGTISPSNNRVLDALLSVLDADRIPDTEQLPNELFAAELKAVVDVILEKFPHFSAEEKTEAKSQTLSYIANTPCKELIESVKRLPQRKTPVMQRIVWFLVFGLFALMVPFRWLFIVMDWLTSSTKDDCREFENRGTIKTLVEVSDNLSRSLVPGRQAPCYCCTVDRH